MGRLLLIEDDDRLARMVARALQDAGHSVYRAAAGGEGLELALRNEFDLILLDLLLPVISGREVLARLVDTRPHQRVLVLSGVTDIGTRVACLDGGAVDYLPKPFSLSELLARVRVRLRQPNSPAAEAYLSAGPVRLDLRLRRVTVNGREINLPLREFLLLQYLMARVGGVCTRDQLLADVWGMGFDPGSNVVDACVRRLRARLDRPDRVETVRNVGYRLIAE